MTGHCLHVRTPSRLHFGLLGWGPESPRQFGGLGLMIESPGLELRVEASPASSVQGPLADRVRRILDVLRDRSNELGLQVPEVSVRVIQAPPEHVGLGVGTQLSLALAGAITRLSGSPPLPAERLAVLTGRGRRSGIGLHGFRHGGFLVDGGRRGDDQGVPPLLSRLPFPDDWSILVIEPPGRRGLHGTDETRAFAILPPTRKELTDRLCRTALLGILPAIAERDLPAFGAALEEFQAQVGEAFAPAQGGPYSAPGAEAIFAELHDLGFVGCGQSSWGPTLYGFSDRPPAEVGDLAQVLCRRLDLDPSCAIITRASNSGAWIEPS